MYAGDEHGSVVGIAELLSGIQLHLHAGAVSIVLTLLGIDLSFTDLKGVRQRILVDGMLKGNGKAIPLVHAVARIELAAVLIAERQVIAGAGNQEGGRCNNQDYCSGHAYALSQLHFRTLSGLGVLTERRSPCSTSRRRDAGRRSRQQHPRGSGSRTWPELWPGQPDCRTWPW